MSNIALVLEVGDRVSVTIEPELLLNCISDYQEQVENETGEQLMNPVGSFINYLCEVLAENVVQALEGDRDE